MRTEDGVLDYSKSILTNPAFFIKLGKIAGLLGQRVLYSLFILYYLMFDKSIPLKVRSIFMGTSGNILSYLNDPGGRFSTTLLDLQMISL